MTRCAFVIPGDISTPTGGYAYDRAILARLPAHGVEVQHVVLPASFPSPSAADLAETERLLQATAANSALMIDGLAYGVFPRPLIERLGRRIVALCHHPLGHETGLKPARRAELIASETIALAAARHVIVTGAEVGKMLVADFGVASARITVAEPGTDQAPRAIGTGAPLQLLAVGSVVPRKGYDVLIGAVAGLADLDWRLTIAGALDRDLDTVEHVRRTIAASGIADRVTLAGAVDADRLADLYHRADVFVMSSHYEGFGMVLTEAVARGLAIVTTRCGTAAEAIPDAAALKVTTGDATAIDAALRKVVLDQALRQRLADAAWQHARLLPTWNDTAGRVAAALKGVTA